MDKVEVFLNRECILLIQKKDPDLLQKTIKEYENYELNEDDVFAILLNDELSYYEVYFRQLLEKYNTTPRGKDPYDLKYYEAKYIHDNAIKYVNKGYLIEDGFTCLTPISILRCMNITKHKDQFDLFWADWKDKIDECITIDLMWRSTRSSHRSYAYAESVAIIKILLNRIYEENITASKFYGIKLNYEDSYLEEIKSCLVLDPINEMFKVRPGYKYIDIPESIITNSVLLHHRKLIYNYETGKYIGTGYSATLSTEREYLLRKGKNNKEILALLIMICSAKDKDDKWISAETLEERLALEPTTSNDIFNKAIVRYNEITIDDEHRENTFNRLSRILKEDDINFIKDNYRLFKEYIKLEESNA